MLKTPDYWTTIVMQNRYIKSAVELIKPPFSKQQCFIKLFTKLGQAKLVALVNLIKENDMVA